MSTGSVPFGNQNILRLLRKLFNPLASIGWNEIIVSGLLLLLVAGVALVAMSAPVPQAIDSSVMLAAITASAVGIERLMEIFWTVIGQTVGSFWPFTAAHKQMDDFIKTLNNKLAPVFEQAEVEIGKLGTAGDGAQERINEAKQHIEGIKKNLASFQSVVPNNQQSRLLLATTNQAINELETQYPTVDQAAKTARKAIEIAKNTLDTFQDNPARRLISIYVGAILGLVVAGLTGLNVFHATGVGDGLYRLGVAITGLLIGLGADPTHEVIRVLQEVKKSRKAANNESSGSANN